MKIIKVEPISLSDWPGHISSVLYAHGCNLRCRHCHNRDIIFDKNIGAIKWKDVFRQIPKEIDSAVITGGEPFIYPIKEIYSFLEQLKKCGYNIAVHTNGFFPNKIFKLRSLDLIDYAAMDVKHPEYLKSIWCPEGEIKQSISIIITLFADYEFRTTATPEVSKEDIIEIAEYLRNKKAKAYYLQPFIEVDWYEGEPYLSVDELKDIWREIGGWFEKGGVRA